MILEFGHCIEGQTAINNSDGVLSLFPSHFSIQQLLIRTSHRSGRKFSRHKKVGANSQNPKQFQRPSISSEMAGGGASKSSAPHRVRKRVEAESSSSAASLKRAKDGSAFAKCEECCKDVPVALIGFHDCSLDAKIKMNLDTQAVEVPSENQKKPTERKRVKSTEQKAKKKKKVKNPNAPKRPPTAFFVFMEDFRKTFKEANPDCKSVASVAKEGGVTWKSMTDEDKKPYIDRAAELKAEYDKAVASSDAENEQDEDDSREKEGEEQTEKGVDDELDLNFASH